MMISLNPSKGPYLFPSEDPSDEPSQIYSPSPHFISAAYSDIPSQIVHH